MITQVTPDVKIAEEATLPTSPISSKKFLTLAIGGLLGLVLEILGAFIFEFLDDNVKNEEDLKELFTLPSIGFIPQASIFKGRKENHLTLKDVDISSRSKLGEAFRDLRTNIQFLGVKKPIRSIAITSPVMGEGKSFISSLLSLTFSSLNSKVVVVDADLRRPTQHRLFKLDNSKGLSTYLIGESDLKDSLQKVEVSGVAIEVLTSGPIPPNPSELLSSQKMKELIAELKKMGYMVVIDVPALLPVSDSKILSSLVDGVILLSNSGKTKRSHLIKAKEVLDNLKINLIGTVMNCIKDSEYGYYYLYHSNEVKRKPIFQRITSILLSFFL